jgi:SAM-dependent MidA family methyltransferase
VEALLAQFGEPAEKLVVEFGHGSGALAQRMLIRQLLRPSCSVPPSLL